MRAVELVAAMCFVAKQQAAWEGALICMAVLALVVLRVTELADVRIGVTVRTSRAEGAIKTACIAAAPLEWAVALGTIHVGMRTLEIEASHTIVVEIVFGNAE